MCGWSKARGEGEKIAWARERLPASAEKWDAGTRRGQRMGEARQYEVRCHPAWSRSVNAEGRDGGWDFQAWHDTQRGETHHECHQSSANATS